MERVVTTWAAPRPRATAPGRLAEYAQEMFPLAERVPTACLLAGSTLTVLARTHAIAPAVLSVHGLVAAGAVLGSMLILRLMDELKDADVDRRLFATRPLPSGRVRESDLHAALAAATGAFVALHARTALPTALVVLAYAGLMFVWFFARERMQPCLPLTLATHTPIIPLVLLHLVAVFLDQQGLGWRALHAPAVALLVLAYWAALLGWEVARKIRAREDEDAYVTYSRLLGPGGAVAFAAAAQSLALASVVALTARYRLGSGFLLLAGAGWTIAMAGHARFLLRPSAATSQLRPLAEIQLLLLFAGGLLA
jgi:4-hydroxybenzoate polyprenyltransferase